MYCSYERQLYVQVYIYSAGVRKSNASRTSVHTEITA